MVSSAPSAIAQTYENKDVDWGGPAMLRLSTQSGTVTASGASRWEMAYQIVSTATLTDANFALLFVWLPDGSRGRACSYDSAAGSWACSTATGTQFTFRVVEVSSTSSYVPLTDTDLPRSSPPRADFDVATLEPTDRVPMVHGGALAVGGSIEGTFVIEMTPAVLNVELMFAVVDRPLGAPSPGPGGRPPRVYPSRDVEDEGGGCVCVPLAGGAGWTWPSWALLLGLVVLRLRSTLATVSPYIAGRRGPPTDGDDRG